jgi:hypothetical protein
MSTIELSAGCNRWYKGDATWHAAQNDFLTALADAGFVAFTGPSGLCGGKSETRSVVVIHRGGGKKWEVVFREHETDLVTAKTTNLPAVTAFSLMWLHGEPLALGEDSLHSVGR